MTQTPKRKFKAGDPVMLPSGIVQELTSIQYVHNRYQLYDVSGWQYGIEHLQPADWKAEALKWRQEALRRYPTPEAYEAACTALEKHRTRADAAEEREKQLKFALELEWVAAIAKYNSIDKLLSTLYPDTPAPKEGDNQ